MFPYYNWKQKRVVCMHVDDFEPEIKTTYEYQPEIGDIYEDVDDDTDEESE